MRVRLRFWGSAILSLMAAAAVLAEPNVPSANAASRPARFASLPLADEIVVHKAARRLELLHRGEVLRSYRIALGLVPTGHKERQGDFRTPEGRYRLARRNPRSDYFLSIQISYPDATDQRRARGNGWDPGGDIMIHGMPNAPRKELAYYSSQDWTDGCIAVSNADMVEIWLLTRDDLPIEIRP
jgi:murein L,D-transpeptidase YafK